MEKVTANVDFGLQQEQVAIPIKVKSEENLKLKV